MNKNTDIYTIDILNEEIDKLMKKFIAGASIVFITRDGGLLLGAVTEGDIYRFLNAKKIMQLKELFNKNIKRIIYNDDKQVYRDAEIIFNSNGKIHNIPVIDKTGKLLFQIDKFRENTNKSNIFKDILEAAENGSIEYFLNSCSNGKVIITGADYNMLHEIKNFFYKHYNRLILDKDISINITDDIDDDCINDSKTGIISLSRIGLMYLRNIKNINTDIITVHELVCYSELKIINTFDNKVINTFMNIFKINMVAFYYLNKAILLFIDELKKYNIKIYYLKDEVINEKYIIEDIISSMDIFLISGNNDEYIEKISIKDFLSLIKYVQRYMQLKGTDLTYNDFMQLSVSHLEDLHNLGFTGFLQMVDSLWEKELHSNIRNKTNLDIITKYHDIIPGEKYIIDKSNFSKKTNEDLMIFVKEYFLIYICEMELLEIIYEKCKNIYIISKTLSMQNVSYDGRDRDSYIVNKDFFPDNFTSDICGFDESYLVKVIKDRAGCKQVKLNDSYYKYSSNYHSQFFNTDLYGNRIVTDAPNEFMGTVWILGHCFFSGYAVEDKHTVASQIQKYINLSGYKYRVVNLSCDGKELALYKLLEKNIVLNDIVIVQSELYLKIKNIIYMDYDELDSYFDGKAWFWNTPSHMGHSGYEFMAKKIFKTIEPVMHETKNIYNYTFHLDINLEYKIEEYIKYVKSFLCKNSFYQKIYNICEMSGLGGDNNKPKIGAVVMNCNPFTYGHQYLIETASRLVDLLYVFVVEENKSIFSFKDRFYMVKEGVKQYNNVVVIPSGSFMISSVTFPGYFMKDTPTGESYDDFLDLKIFAHYISPAFGIIARFVGEEPFDRVTAQYNCDMKVLLKEAGIDVIEIPRKKFSNSFISATKVREILKEKDYNLLKNYLPETTMQKINEIIHMDGNIF